MTYLLITLIVTISMYVLNVACSSTTPATSLSDMHKEVLNMTNNLMGCEKECKRRKFNGTYPPGKLPLTRFMFLPCFCDEPTCHEFGDCCVDLLENTWETSRRDSIQGFPAKDWRCQFFSYIGPKREKQYAWMVSSCANSGLLDPFFATQCEAKVEILKDNYTYLHDIPRVLNETNGTIFRNIYCAMCNGYALDDLLPISVQIKCSSDSISVDEILEAKYIAGKREWKKENITCALNVVEYEDMVALNNKNDLSIRQCQPVIDTCPVDWQDDKVAKKCDAYSLVVKDKFNSTNVYKNPHCAECHNVIEPRCPTSTGGIVPLGKAPIQSLSVVFHFSFGGTVVGQTACVEGFIWDTIFKQCRPVFTCDPNSKYRSKQCSLGSKLTCDTVILESDEFSILPNGSLYVNTSHDIVSPDKYKVLEVQNEVEVCAEDVHTSSDNSSFSELQGMLTLVCTCVSLLGLAMHVCVLISLPRLRNLPGLIALATSLALFAAQALFLWATSTKRPHNTFFCVALAVILHFCFLKVFAWTSVMSYDIWRTFSHPTGYALGRRSGSRKTQFFKYVIFATAVPGIIVCFSLLLDIIFPDLGISPGYSDSSLCWFGNRAGLALFFAAPVCVMLLANIIMYAIVVVHIRNQRRAAQCLSELNEQSCTPRYSEGDCKLHFSIFNVMGGTWVLGILAGLIDRPALWYIFIILNGSQGALIFILQIMKPRVWEMIRNKVAGREDSTKTPNTLLSSQNTKNSSSSKEDSMIRKSRTE